MIGFRNRVSAFRKTGLRLYLVHAWCRITGQTRVVRARFGETNLRLRAGTADVVVARDGLGGEFDALASVLPHDFAGTIVDAGAHIGSTALALAALWPRATILSLEPSQENLGLLRENVSGHDRIRVFAMALCARSGTALLSDRGTGTWGASLVAGAEATGPGQSVECMTLAELQELAGPAGIGLLKLDIEGAEKDIFEICGAELAGIPVVMAELHDRILPGCSAAFENFAQGRVVRQMGPEKLVAIRPDAARLVA